MSSSITADGSPTPRKATFRPTMEDLRVDTTPEVLGGVGSRVGYHLPIGTPLTVRVQGGKRPLNTTTTRGNQLPPVQSNASLMPERAVLDAHKVSTHPHSLHGPPLTDPLGLVPACPRALAPSQGRPLVLSQPQQGG